MREPCGCHISKQLPNEKPNDNPSSWHLYESYRIAFCPLHASAERIREALSDLIECSEDIYNSDDAEAKEARWYASLDNAKDALSQAKGEKQE